MTEERGKGKSVYLTLHENFVREDVAYTDRATGERRTFNQVRLPAGTVIDGRDVGGYEFSLLFVDPSRFKGPEWRDIPLLANREVRLKRSLLDPEGRPVTDADGKRVRDVVKVMPQQIKDALAASRRAWAEEHGDDPRALADRGRAAKDSAEAIDRSGRVRPDAREIG